MRGGHCGLEAPSPAEQARLRQGDLHFVPAHAGHPGNEAADKEAAYPKTEEGKRADAEEQQRVPLPLASARAAIRAHHRGKRMDALATVRDPRKRSTKLRQEVYWRLTAGAAARPQHRKLHRLGEKLWHQLWTGYGPLGYVFGSLGSPRPIPYGYKCPACGAEDMSLLHVLAWCSHTETVEEAVKLGLRFVLRDASKTVEQRAKAARWMTRVYPARVLRLLCRSGWIDTCENLLIRPGAADPMSPGEVACLESEAIARADAEVLEEATREALAAQLRRGVLAVRDRERAAGVRRRVAVLPSLPETRSTFHRSAGPSQQETRAEFEKRRDALRESNMAATAVLQRRLDEKRAWLRKWSKELVEVRGVGADAWRSSGSRGSTTCTWSTRPRCPANRPKISTRSEATDQGGSVPLCEDRVEERKTTNKTKPKTKTKTKHKKQTTPNPNSLYPQKILLSSFPPPHPIVNRAPPSPLPQCQIVPPSPTQNSCLFLGVHICAYLLKRGTHSVLAQTASWQGVTLVYFSYPWWL